MLFVIVFAEETITTRPSKESENRCDIIKFYNSVYVQKLQPFVRKFSNGNGQVSYT